MTKFVNPHSRKGSNIYVGAIAAFVNRSKPHVSLLLSGERRGAKSIEKSIMRFARRNHFDIDFSSLGWL